MQLSTWAVVPAGSIRGALKQKSGAAAQALAAGVAVYVAARFFGRKLLSGASSRQGVDDGHQDPRSDESALEEIMPSPLGAPGAGYTPRAAGLLRRLRAGLASVRGRVETIEELMTSNVEDARQRLDVADRQSARSVLARNRELKAVVGKLAHYEALLESRLQELEAAAIGKEIARDLAEAALLELEMQDESDDYCNNILEMNFFCAASGAGQGSVSTASAPGAKDSASRETATGEAEKTQAQPAQKVPQQQGAVRTEKRVKSPAARGFTPGGKSRSASKAAAGGKKKALFPAPKMDSSQVAVRAGRSPARTQPARAPNQGKAAAAGTKSKAASLFPSPPGGARVPSAGLKTTVAAGRAVRNRMVNANAASKAKSVSPARGDPVLGSGPFKKAATNKSRAASGRKLQ